MRLTVTSAVFILSVMFIAPAVFAEHQVMVHDAWVRPVPPGAQTTAGYMNIKNISDAPIDLTGASCGVFGRVELHMTEMHGDMMHMVRQERITVPAGGSLTLAPGGYHLMLIEPKESVTEGKEVDIDLLFSNGERLNVPSRVTSSGKGGVMEEHRHH